MKDLNYRNPQIEVSERINTLDELDKILAELSAPPKDGRIDYQDLYGVENSRLSYTQWLERCYQVMKGERSVKRLSGGIYLFDFSQVKPI